MNFVKTIPNIFSLEYKETSFEKKQTNLKEFTLNDFQIDSRFYGGKLKSVAKIKNTNFYAFIGQDEILGIGIENWGKLNQTELKIIGDKYNVPHKIGMKNSEYADLLSRTLR